MPDEVLTIKEVAALLKLAEGGHGVSADPARSRGREGKSGSHE